ncbi:MAG: carbon-nitrogen hydrolase family protein [Clostridiales bacterium]|nr:carbon-nitrogen hydrolase family protein [Clostridiales bacterium]
MKLCFATKDTLNHVFEEKLSKVAGCDVLTFGFNGLGLVSYKKELSGETEYFQDVAKLSKQLSSVVICGCDTDNYGVYRHSVVIADSGKLLGVSDMAHSFGDSEYAPGGNFRVYDTHVGKIGLIVQEDLFFPETSRVLTLCDADLLICVFKKLENLMPQIMMRACSFSNGVAMAVCAHNYACISDIRGNVKVAGSLDFINANVKIEKDYHLISSRRRGLYRDFNSGY